MQKVSGHFIADGSAVNVECGFVPDKVYLLHGLEETNPVEHLFIRELANTANANGQYGLQDSGGTKTKLSSAAAGFATYDTKVLKAMIPAPNGEGETAATIVEYADASSPTARTTSAVGTVCRPSTRNGYIYECTSSSGAVDTEPTWGTVVGETTTDGQSNVWICRNEKLKVVGCKGFTLGATLSTDTDEWYYEAEKHDSIAPERDAASYDPVGKHPNS